jgi:hypothetical protein
MTKTPVTSALFGATNLGATCALTATFLLPQASYADSMITVNADGTVTQVESATQSADASALNGAQNFDAGTFEQSDAPSQSAQDLNQPSLNTQSRAARGVNQNAVALPNQPLLHTQPYPYRPGNSDNNRWSRRPSRNPRNGRPIVVRPGTNIVVNGDDTTIIVQPGYGGYPYNGYPYGYAYRYQGVPIYGYWPGSGFIGGDPYYGYGTTYGPGTYSSHYNETYNNGGLGLSVGGGGVNITLGGGRSTLSSRSTTTVMPGASITTTGPRPGSGYPGIGMYSPGAGMRRR